ncbi:hypothetical protein HYQ44_002444 [Verticillium longisporum]|nr:hypothetical protein HYQ44_002444 [Verticillium longisporum]
MTKECSYPTRSRQLPCDSYRDLWGGGGRRVFIYARAFHRRSQTQEMRYPDYQVVAFRRVCAPLDTER